METKTEPEQDAMKNPLEPVNKSMELVKRFLANIPDSEQIRTSSSDVCPHCSGGKLMLVDDPRGEYRGVLPKVSVTCVCVRENQIARQLSRVPEIYKDATVETLKAQPHIHEEQTRAVELIKDNPDQNFAFIGDFGKGKTHFFYCLHNHAVVRGSKVYASTLMALVAEFQSVINRSMAGELNVKASISGEDLRQSETRFSLFLDDIDKAKPTEYVAQILFDLIDSAINYKHQVVWTSNLDPDALAAHFKRADPRFGGAIVRRLLTSTNLVEMW